MEQKKFFGRDEEIKTIEKFLSENKTDSLFIKGRRRVGKSWILHEIMSKKINEKKIIYHLGTLKIVDTELFDLLKKIEVKYGQEEITNNLLYSKTNKISVDDFFKRLLEIVRKRKTLTILIVDEIQWIGKDNGAEFSAKLKEYWVALEKTNKFKIIITGSSYKYFAEYVSKSDAILRSISSYSPITVEPFTPSELKKFFFPEEKYKHYHVMLIYMMTGGVSQYISWLKNKEDGFEFCINSSFFKKESSFRTEIKELLKIDLSDEKQTTAISVLEEMKNLTLGLKEIFDRVQKKHAISESTVRRILEELIGMEFVSCKTLDGRIINEPLLTEESHKKFYISDLFLSFYFTLVYQFKNQIEHNESDNIFSTLLSSKKEDFDEDAKLKIPVISEFTGNAFELALINVLKRKQIKKLPIFKKMKIEDTNFEVDTYNKSSKDQIDVFVSYETYGIIKVIECKWVGRLDKKASDYCDEVSSKKFHNSLGTHPRENYYMFTIPIQSKNVKTFNKKEVVILNYKDLFE